VVGIVLVVASVSACRGEDRPLLTANFDTTTVPTTVPDTVATSTPETTAATGTTKAAEPPASTTATLPTTSTGPTASTLSPTTTAATTPTAGTPTTLPQFTLTEVGAALQAPAAAYIASRGGAAETEALRKAAAQLLDSGRADGLAPIPTPDGKASVSVLLEFLAAQPDFVWVKLLERGGVLSGLPVFFLDGIYRVGTDVQPGFYEAFDVEYCFWQRIDRNGRQIDSFYTELAPRALAAIAPSDYGFASKDCGIWFRLG
jgi:hypothetical protein